MLNFKKLTSTMLALSICATTINLPAKAEILINEAQTKAFPSPRTIQISKKGYINITDNEIIFHNISPNDSRVVHTRNYDFYDVFKSGDIGEKESSGFFSEFMSNKEYSKLTEKLVENLLFFGIPYEVFRNKEFVQFLMQEMAYKTNSSMKLIKSTINDTISASRSEDFYDFISHLKATGQKYTPHMLLLGATYFSTNLIGIFDSAYSALLATISFVSRKLSVSWNKAERNPEQVAIKLQQALKEKIVGQDEAIEKIVSKIASFREKNEYKNKNKNACIMLLYGDSGTGKSETANVVSKTLCKTNEPININPQMLKIDNSNEGKSPIEQIFGKVVSVDHKGRKTETPTKIANQVMSNNETVIIFEEIDKMRRFDPTGAIDEFLRQIIDRGRATVEGNELDFTKTIILATTNESKEHLEQGLSLGRQRKDIIIKDDTGARTVVDRDQSLLNRIFKVEFVQLSKDALVKIAQPRFNEIAQHYKKYYKLNVQISNSTLHSLVSQAVKKQKGARAINEYIEQVAAAIVQFRIDCKQQNNPFKNKTISIEFDPQTDKIFIRCLP